MNLMEKEQSSSTHMNVDQVDSSSSGTNQNETTTMTEELMEHKKIAGTPFTFVNDKEKNLRYIVLGVYMVSQPSENLTYEQASKMIDEKGWDLIINTMAAMVTAYSNNITR